MKNMPVILRYLLWPLALLYGLVVELRNKLYDWGLSKSVRFDVPLVTVGNLSMGGTGKTMLIEYLIRLLHERLAVAVLSRGYKRQTSGFRFVDYNCTAAEVGDEPCQLKKKYPEVPVAVGVQRMYAVPQILGSAPNTRAILLDDGLQHRSVSPGLAILLTDYHHLYTRDHVVPMGTLREGRHNARRANILLLTKCPPDLSEEAQAAIRKELNPEPEQSLYFATLRYGSPYPLANGTKPLTSILQSPRQRQEAALLTVTGIGNPAPLEQYLQENFALRHTMRFADHHDFVEDDLWAILQRYEALEHNHKAVITTEKDGVRMMAHQQWLRKQNIPLYALPVEADFLGDQGAKFDEQLIRFIENYR